MTQRRNSRSDDISISLTYGVSADQIRTGKVKMASTEGVDDLSRALATKIPEFQHQEFVIVHDTPKGRMIIQDPLTAGPLTFAKKESVLVLPQKVDVLVKTADQDPKSVTIDVREPVRCALQDILGSGSYPCRKYVLAFQPSAKQPFLQVCCQSMPLVSQGWFFHTLVMIRRLYVEDVPLTIDDELRQLLLRNCRLAANWNLSYFPLDAWAELSALQFVYEMKGGEIDIQYIRQNVARCVAPGVKGDDSLVEKISEHLKHLGCFTPEQAESMYVQTAAEGCQCAYIEKVILKGKSVIKKTRFLMVSPSKIVLVKDFEKPAEQVVPLDKWEKVDMKGEDVIIQFKDREPWIIASEKPLILSAIFDEISSPTDLDPEEENLLRMHKPITGDYESDYVTIAPMRQVTSRESTLVDKEPVVSRVSSTILTPSQFVYDELEATKSAPGMEIALVPKSEVRKEKLMPMGIGERVPADPSELEMPYTLMSDIRNLEIIKKLDPNEEVETNTKPIDADKFFELAPSEMWYHNSFLMVLLCCLIFYIMKRVWHFVR